MAAEQTPHHRQHRIEIVESFEPRELPPGSLTKLRVSMVGDGMGGLVNCPVVVVRGVSDGPVVGLTAAIHGNELNGMKVIQRIITHLRPTKLSGTVICVPVVNVPGYLENTRQFNDGQDLNRLMPGKLGGTKSEVYAHRFITRVVHHFDYLLDLHTASFGRINTFYVRADLTNPDCAWMAQCQQPQILLHNTGIDGSLRGAAMNRGVKAITVEIGNPNSVQAALVEDGTTGVNNLLSRLGMIDEPEQQNPRQPVTCVRSSWMYTRTGGVLDVYPALAARVREGELVARVTNIFGEVTDEYRAPADGIVIGRSTHPVNQTGSRIIHLGVEGTLDDIEAPGEGAGAAPAPAPC